MNFKEGSAIFYATAANHRLHPLGPTRRVIVGNGSNVESVPVPKPVVEFANHHAAVEDPETARGMFKSDWFGRRDGFILVADCLPEKVQIIWPKLIRTAKRKVATQLVDDVPEDDIIEALTDADYDMKDDPIAAAEEEGHEILVQCPVKGCMAAPFRATTKNAVEILRVHQIAKHGGIQPSA